MFSGLIGFDGFVVPAYIAPLPRRTPMQIFADYKDRIGEARALTEEWFATADSLRKMELAAIIEASREVSNALMREYRDACAARVEELRHFDP